MDEDNRADDQQEEEDSEAGWYFDLPKGAWERQEAKNRELRQSVRRNMDTEEPKKDVFGGAAGQQQKSEPPPLFRPSHLQDEDEDEAIRRRWHFDEDTSDAAEGEQDQIVWGNAGVSGGGPEYSTEPEIPAPAPFRLRSQRMPEEDEAPHLTPPAGLFSEEEDSPEPPLMREVAEEPQIAASSPVTPPAQPEEPQPFVPQAPEPAAEQSRSRWDEFFGTKAGEDSSMLEGMRSWATGRDEPKPADDSDSPATPEPASTPSALAPETPPAAPIDINAIPLRRRSHSEDEPAAIVPEPEPAPEPEEPKSRWDEMFSAKAGDGGMLESMRAWAKGAQDDDQPAEPRMRLAPEPDDDEPGPSFSEPFAWEQSSSPETLPSFPADDPGEEKKGGLVGRLFGRKKKDEAPPDEYAVASRTGWFDSDDEPSELPPPLSFSASSEDAQSGSWLGRSDGGENRFDFTREEPESDAEPTEFRWQPTIGDDSPFGSELPEQPAASAGPWGANEPWQPAPRQPMAADITPGEPDAEVAEELAWATAGEPELASTTPGPVPVPDEDPWQSVEAVEEDVPAASSVDPEDASDAAREPSLPAWSAVLSDETSSGVEEEESPSSLADDVEDDPWAAFIARRQAAEEPASAHDEIPKAPQEAPRSLWDPAATAAAEDAPSLWDSAFARIQSPEPEDEPLTAGEDEETPAPTSDDPWAAIAEVSGYDAGSDEVAVYRGPAEPDGLDEVPDDVGPDFDEPEEVSAQEEPQPFEPRIYGQYGHSRDSGPDARPEPTHLEEPALRASLEEDAFAANIYPDDMPQYPSSHGADYHTADDRRPLALPEWDDSKIDDDTVLRAFEAHASAYDDDRVQQPAAPVFHDLLGDDAEEVLAEASDDSSESQYFGRMQGWAPQRSGGRTPYPWEVDEDQPSREADRRDDERDDWSGGGSQPPWGGEMVSPAQHAGAPSARHRSRSRMLVREIVETGLLALLVFLAVRASFQNFKVDGLSMWPTLDDGEYLIVNKLAYAEVDMERLSNFVPFVNPGDNPDKEVFGGPQRGDIIVLKDPAEPDIDLIKRIIGMPGETLEIVDGKVYINDHLLIEPYIQHEWHDTKPKIAIPEGYYFVMGDNRDNSKDSRNGSIGLIPKDLIIGKAMLTYWPKNKFGLAPNEEGDISEKDGRPQITAQTVEP